ncbi:MAG: carboxymuconolactone decarboxylase family protein [Gemmatimonadales bacterium]
MDTIVGTLFRRGAAIWRALAGRNGSAAPSITGTRVLPAYAALARHRNTAGDLDPRLRLLVTQLAAERSHCRWCVERGRHLWREAQLSLDALRSLPRYETSSAFSVRERAALRFTDALTRYTDAMPLEPLTRARTELREAEIAAITAVVADTHFFNPITGSLGAQTAPWGAPIGSSLRNFWL